MDGLVGEVARTALLEVAALFPIVNPVGTAPIFLSLTRGASSRTRTTLATRIALNGFVLLVASMLVGSYILAFFGVSLWSERLERMLGESAVNVFLRLSSFLLLCIGVQILANGIKALKLL